MSAETSSVLSIGDSCRKADKAAMEPQACPIAVAAAGVWPFRIHRAQWHCRGAPRS